MTKPKNIYRIIFHNQGKVYELYAGRVFQGDLYGFIEVEELLFGEHSGLLVNPAEERLQAEFAGVQRTFIPLYTVLRIDEVEKEGVSKIPFGQRSSRQCRPLSRPLLSAGRRPQGQGISDCRYSPASFGPTVLAQIN